ncbi:MAG TPA: hypothetical protein VMJ30_07170 [Gemmatimonadales bacterium]|nr:hypothetical protein [Gemmatimonadales bacterium]
MTIRWTPERLDQLERAALDGRRVILSRRGTEYVVQARRIESDQRGDTLVGRLPMTGEEMRFLLNELDHFQVVGEKS